MRLRDRVAAFMGQARTDLSGLVAIRSVADPSRFPRAECVRAAEWVMDRFASVGFTDIGLHETGDGNLAVYGERRVADPAAPTVLIYARYDVQPPLDEPAWHTPPFRLTEVDGRWYGRGTADGKGTIVTHLTALRALAGRMPVTLKLLVGGSTAEQGTGGLVDFVARNPSLLRADAVLVGDTGNAAVAPAATMTLRSVVGSAVTIQPRTGGRAFRALVSAMNDAFGRPVVTLGQGNSIPLRAVLANIFPDAEILLMGAEDPPALVHAPDESVHPSEIEMLAMAEALFLCRYGGW